MTALAVAAILALALLAGPFISDRYRDRSRARMVRVRRKAVVNLRSGRSFVGLLWEEGEGYVVLRNAEMLEGRERVPMDGEVVLEISNIEFMQVPG